MGIPNVLHTGRTAMSSSRAAIATAGHNIANANTEGYSRQRVLVEAVPAKDSSAGSSAVIGRGVQIARVDRLNDLYLDKQIRNSSRDLANSEEKDVVLRQTEDVFNELGGEGLSTLVGRFFNEFRKLGNEADSEAVRHSVRESSTAMVNDLRRMRKEVDEVRRHIDSRIEGHIDEVNSLTLQVKDLNLKIKSMTIGGAVPNDLMDQRDLALKKLGSFMELHMHQNNSGEYLVDAVGLGPLVVGPNALRFEVIRSPADADGKPEGSLDIRSEGSAAGIVTHAVKGGKLGALLEVRDQILSGVLDRLDELAYSVSGAVNAIHRQGFTRDGVSGVGFFRELGGKERAAEFIDLSDEVKASTSFIATAAAPDSPGDNRIALAISGLQGQRFVGGAATPDDWYNSIVSQIGVVSARNRNGMNQQKDILNQMSKMRDQMAGVSIDEETANIMQYHQTFGASAKVVQVADEMLNTILSLKK